MSASEGTSNSGPLGSKKRQLSLFSHVRWEHLAAGVTGGVMSTLALHPLDLIKIRFQVNEGVASVQLSSPQRPQYRGIMDALVTIARQEGVKGLYQGVTPNVWGAGASWGLYFLFYNAAKTWLQQKNNVTVLSSGQHMLAATEAGVCTLLLTNPVWVAKTRMCLQYEGGAKGGQQYRGMMDCLVKIYAAEGYRGLYKGLVPGLFGVSHGALQFMAYEELKKTYNGYRNMPLDTKFGTVEYLCFAALSKIFAASTTYPYQVVRARLQDQHRSYTGLMDVLRQTWRFEGVRGFYKGLGTALIRVTPACCITFVTYEKMIAYLMPTPENKNGKNEIQDKNQTENKNHSQNNVTENKNLSQNNSEIDKKIKDTQNKNA